jgi:tetratricopeptide (TPR) repeat protein
MASKNWINKYTYAVTTASISLLFGLTACQTTKEPKAGKSEPQQAEAQAPEATKSAPEPKDKPEPRSDAPSVEVSGNTVPLVFSLNNNGLTSHTVNREKAATLAEQVNAGLANPDYKDRPGLVGLMSLQSLAGVPVEELFSASRRLINLEMSKDITKDLPDVSYLHLALAAMNNQNLSMTEHFIYKLIAESKNKEVKAEAYVIEGLIALMDDRLPEAMEAWQDALKQNPSCRAALLNAGFLALRYGDFKTAKQHLGKIDEDWYAAYGLLIAARLEGRNDEVPGLCSKVLSKKAKYRPAMFSCALHEYQAKRDYKKSITMLNEMLKDGKGPASLDEKIYQVLDRIQRVKEEEELKKREAAAAAKAGKKKQDGGGPADGGKQPAPVAGGAESKAGQ